MKFIKEHKNLFIAIIIFFLVLLLAFLSQKLLTNTENKAIYGDRLKEVNVKVNEKDIESKLSDLKDGVEDISVRKQGKIINITIVVNKDIDLDKAKEIGTNSLKAISEKQIKVYDIQIFIKKNTKDDKFPIIGYKNHARDNISWTRNR